jgi:hypothetical protein
MLLPDMALPSAHSHLHRLPPRPADADVYVRPAGADTPRRPSYSSDIRSIHARERSESASEGNSSPHRAIGVELGHPDFHEPTANLIVLLASLLMLTGAVWWGSSQLEHHEPREPVTAPASGEGLQRIPGSSVGEVPAGS